MQAHVLLWAVDDLSTSLLMQRFYDNIVNKNMGKASGLREAQLWVRDMRVKDLRLMVKELLENIQNQDGPVPFKIRRLAQKYKRMADDDRAFIHPYYWGAFVFSGNWN